LEIKETSWSGSSDYGSEEKEYQYDVEPGKKYIVKTKTVSYGDSEKKEEDVLVFTVTEVNADSIKIKTTENFSDAEDGINLKSDKKEFKIVVGTDLRLATPTMDAGNVFVFTLTK
jgi:hypothetical protein